MFAVPIATGLPPQNEIQIIGLIVINKGLSRAFADGGLRRVPTRLVCTSVLGS